MNKERNKNLPKITHTERKHYAYKLMIRIGAVATASMLLTGCSSSRNATDAADMSKASMMESAATDNIYEAGADNGEPTAVTGEGTGEKSGIESKVTESSKQSNRKLIKNIDMDVETEEYDTLLTNVQARIEELNGYVENLNTGEDTSYPDTESRNRYATITSKVPADKVDQFVTEVSKISNVIRKNESVDDVTLQYVDLESHKKMLITEEKRLLELLADAENVEDIIAIESRLSEVRYQIDSMESQLRTFDNQINYSTVNIYITEVNRLTPTQDKGTWEKISSGFIENVYRVGRGCKNFVIGFLINLPILMVVALFGVILFLLVLFIIKRCRKQREKMSTRRNTNQIQSQSGKNMPSQNNETKAE